VRVMMRLLPPLLLAAGCASAVAQNADAARTDAFVSRECTWSEPPSPGVCDGGGQEECESGAAATAQSSALIVVSACASGDCMAAHDCAGPGRCTCGSEPACAHGSVCAVRPGESVPSCIVCVR
jgi:hypothetical protein